MNNDYNRKLGVCIPTYNRAHKLELTMQKWIGICKEHKVPIFISDNNSLDNTLQIVQKYQEEYPYIFYSKNKENLGPDKNFELVLKQADTDYRWLMGDDDLIEKGSIADILSLLEYDYDMVILNFPRHIHDTKSKLYTDMNELMFELGSAMTFMSTFLLSKKLVESKEFYDVYNISNIKNYHFAHLAAVFSYLSQGSKKVYFCADIVIKGMESKEPLSWMALIIDYFVNDLSITVNSLPDFYTKRSKKECVKRIKTHCWGKKAYFYNVMAVKCMKKFSIAFYIKSFKHIKNIFNFFERMILLAFALTPRFLFIAVREIRRKLRKKDKQESNK